MPIKPENRARYPKDWPQISERIRFERARGRCECSGECGADHGGKPGKRCDAMHGDPHPVTGSNVVLTVAHMDHTPENCGDGNLKAMCQRCHLRYDAGHHKLNSWRTRRAKCAAGDLFEDSDNTPAPE